MKLKVFVVGAGTMGSVHARAYAGMADVELVGIVDVRKDVGTALAKELSTGWFASLEDLLKSQKPDIADICVPTDLHPGYVATCAERGMQVICEKPIARTLKEARGMIDVCAKNKVRLFVGHVVRFFPEYRRARELINANEIGTPATAFAMRGGGFPRAWEDWYADPARSGTLLVDLMIHDFDFLRWTFGEVERVYAKSLLGRGLTAIDHAFVSLRFASGLVASVEGTWADPSGFHTSFEFTGTGGILTHSSELERPLLTFRKSPEAAAAGVAVPECPLAKSPYQEELEHFVDCIRTGAEAVVTAEDAYRALEIALAALESVQSGEPVSLAAGAV